METELYTKALSVYKFSLSYQSVKMIVYGHAAVFRVDFKYKTIFGKW